MYEEEDVEDKKRMSLLTASTSNMELGGGGAANDGVTPTLESNGPSGRSGLMSGIFRGGRRNNDVEAQNGVAMAPVGASAAAVGEGEKKKEVRKGVRVVIRLEARGENG